jgi:hypothetical protein
MFVRASPAYKVSHGVLLQARRLGARAALPHGAFVNLARSKHLLQPTERGMQLSSTDPFDIRDPEELVQVQRYRDVVAGGSFGSMEAVQQRVKALRSGLGSGQDDADWMRKDVHGMYVTRTAFHPILSDPAKYSTYSADHGKAAGIAKKAAAVGDGKHSTGALISGLNPLAMRANPGLAAQYSVRPEVRATATASAGKGGYGITLKARKQVGKQDDEAKPANDWCACCGCVATCCWYTCCCCICSLCCSKACQRIARAQGQLGKKWRHRNDASSPEEAELVAMTNSAPALVQNSTLAHFLSNDFKAVFFYYRHLNMLVLFALAITVVFFANVTSKSFGMTKFFITFLVVMAVVFAMIYESPFLDNEKWKENVKVYSLTLAVMSGLLNYIVFVEGELQEFPMGRNGGRNMSLLVFAMSIGLFLILITSFWRVLVRGAEAEAKALARRKRRLQRLVVDLPQERHVQYPHGNNPLVYRTLVVPRVVANGPASGSDAPAGRRCSSLLAGTSSAAVQQLLQSQRKPSAVLRETPFHQSGETAGGAGVKKAGTAVKRPPGSVNPRPAEVRLKGRKSLVRRTSAFNLPGGGGGSSSLDAMRESGDKWRAAYASANAHLAVMSGKERQQLLREAARERALTKSRLW